MTTHVNTALTSPDLVVFDYDALRGVERAQTSLF